jgi:ppGpp synthetase/RelA/SpoT-type nucleotidyltranferase
MATPKPSPEDRKLAKELIATYERERDKIGLFMDQLLSALRDSSDLSLQVHSLKSRLKDPTHLRDKLFRKMAASRVEGEPFEIDSGNLLSKITDLAGIRILHLYTRQIRDIDAVLREILKEQQYGLREGPFARTWDDESRAFFKECGIETQESPTLYTSVHYVVESASRTLVTCEIQVRTLMEEVWGEVDHLINYPNGTRSYACREQLKVLARVTSSATRLVDAIFLTAQDEKRTSVLAAARKARSRRKR